MKLEKWALIAEVVGGAAIVLSLIFVGLEIRANSNLLEWQIMVERDNRDFLPLYESETLIGLISRIDDVDDVGNAAKNAIMERYGFDSAEATYVLSLHQRQFLGYVTDFRAAGPTDDFRGRVALMLGFPNLRTFWELQGRGFDPEFTRFVDTDVLPLLDGAGE